MPFSILVLSALNFPFMARYRRTVLAYSTLKMWACLQGGMSTITAFPRDPGDGGDLFC